MKKKLIFSIMLLILIINILQISINTVNSYNISQINECTKLNITTDLETQESVIENHTTKVQSLQDTLDPFIPTTMLPLLTPRHIIGIDDRRKVMNTAQFPYSSICYIETIFQNGASMRGTAFMVGDNIAITAGHCIVNRAYGTASSVTLYPGKSESSNPFGTVSAIKYTVPEDYANNFSVENDWGVLVLNSNIRK